MSLCILNDIIQHTLANCYGVACDIICHDYLIDIANNCSIVFNNNEYLRLWNSLYNICSH